MKQRFLTCLLCSGCGLLGLAGATALGLHLWIADAASTNIQEAQRHYPGDGIQAATAMLAAHDTPLDAKGRLVWTLGTLGDERALPLLKTLHTGATCQHQQAVCQYEVEKAIRKINREGHFGVSKPLLGSVWAVSMAAMGAAWWRVRKRHS